MKEMVSGLVTVLITVRNGEAYLDQAIESVLRQSYQPIELVIVDDGSTDGSWKKITAHTDSRIRPFQLSKVGRGAALNHGLEKAKGEFVAILDADDECLSARIERQVEYLEKEKDVALLGCWYRLIYEEGSEDRDVKAPAPEHNLTVRFLWSNPIAHSGIMVRANVLQEIGGYSETITSSIDLDMMTRVAANYPVAVVPEILVLRRIHAANYFRTNLSFFRYQLNSLKVRVRYWRRGKFSIFRIWMPLVPLSMSIIPYPVRTFISRSISRLFR